MTRYLLRPLDPGASCPTEGLVADHSHRNPRGSLSRKASFLASQSDAGAGPLPCVATPSGTHVAFEVPMVGGGWGLWGRPTFPGWTHATSSPISPAEAGHMALTSRGAAGGAGHWGTAVRTDQRSGLSKVFNARDDAQVMALSREQGPAV